MNHIDIYSDTERGAANAALTFIKSIGEESVRAVRLNTTKDVPDYNTPSEEWPVILECRDCTFGMFKFEIRVWGFTSGYYGSGPNDLIRLLKWSGFKFDWNRIVTESPINERLEK